MKDQIHQYDMKYWKSKLVISYLNLDREFEHKWNEGTIRGWDNKDKVENPLTNPLYCGACKKVFANDNVFANHFTGKKHKFNEKKEKGLISKTVEQANNGKLKIKSRN